MSGTFLSPPQELSWHPWLPRDGVRLAGPTSPAAKRQEQGAREGRRGVRRGRRMAPAHQRAHLQSFWSFLTFPN